MAQSNALRPLVQRLTSTPVKELPNIAYFLASSISRCLSYVNSTEPDNTALLHKLKTRISSLLQDRAVEGRFTAVIIIKAVIEAGGREILNDAELWIRGLIAILNKSDPVATKKLCIITISRTFVLTRDYPNIVREITTPLIPAFTTACLASIKPRHTKADQGTEVILSPLLSTVLRCWAELIPQHPPTFRPFITRFKPICLSLLGEPTTPAAVVEGAAAVLIALHYSAPKNSASLEWLQQCQDTIAAAHAVADQVFRPVLEEWTPADPSMHSTTQRREYNREPCGIGEDRLGLTGWAGTHAGMRRLSTLLKVIEISVSSSTAREVSIPLGALSDLWARILSVVVPGGVRASPYVMRINSEVGKEERDALYSEVPSVHLSCLRLLHEVLTILKGGILPISRTILEQLAWVFDGEEGLQDVRCAIYELLCALLPVMGPTATDVEIKLLSKIAQACCKDALPPASEIHSAMNGQGILKVNGAKTVASNVDAFAENTKIDPHKTSISVRSDIRSAASSLVCAFLTYLPGSIIPNSLRTNMDRTAILIQQEQAILASVLNPTASQNSHTAPKSILPFLARASLGLEAEALLRPRRPVIEHREIHDMQGMDSEPSPPELTSGAANGEDLLNSPGLPRVIDGPIDLNIGATLIARDVMHSDHVAADRQPTFPVKRDFATMDVESNKDLTPTVFPDMSREDHVKKSRLADASPSEQPAADHDQIDLPKRQSYEATTSVLAARSSAQDVLPGRSFEAVPSMNGDIQEGKLAALQKEGQVADADSSDSDIPEIDIEPDTDEDEGEDEYIDDE